MEKTYGMNKAEALTYFKAEKIRLENQIKAIEWEIHQIDESIKQVIASTEE